MELSGRRRGKIGETIAIKQLIERGFDVYDNIVDDRGIDLILRNENKANVQHKDVQIKHSKFYHKSNDFWFGIGKSTFKPTKSLYFMFVLDENRIFVIPSIELAKFLKRVWTDKSGNWKIIIKLKENWVVVAKKGSHDVNIERYLNNFSQLR